VVKLSRKFGLPMICLALAFSAIVVNANYFQEQAKPEKQTDAVTISGTVSSITDTALTIVDDQKKELTVSLSPGTKVTKGGKAAALTDVKANDRVTVKAKKDGDAWMAISVAIG
jgi:hypothetical protein